ncbi:Rha family transcriptional regulator [Weissella sagaensis]|uniref:Rha family transcriptional regulator n=1 Tax=Weissella sagaensis TaxID=2559928 RepID=UPI0013EE1FA6|nr:Rha family transcriptional regulator [Weissella sagaensis]
MTQAEQLVELQNGVATTTSLQVAETFGKNHDKILRDVKKQIKKIGSPDVANEMFQEKEYEVRGRTYPMYQMNKDGFTLLVMSYTDDKSMQFKLRYIQAFNEMQKQLDQQSLPMTTDEKIALIAQGNVEFREELDEVKDNVDDLKDRFGLPAAQAKSLEQSRKKHIVTLLGGYDSNAYQHISGKTFKQIGRDFKERFNIPRYDSLPLSKFDEGMDYIKTWLLPTNLALEVRELNSQTKLDV